MSDKLKKPLSPPLEDIPLTKKNEEPLTKEIENLQIVEESSKDVEEVIHEVEESSKDVEEPIYEPVEIALTKEIEEPLTKEKAIHFHEKNYAQSEEVELFIRHLGQSAPGSALKMIENDEIVIFDKDTYQGLLEKYQFLLSNHELMGRMVDVVNPMLLAIFEKTQKMNGKSLLLQGAFMTANINFFLEQSAKIHKLLEDEAIHRDFMAFKELMLSFTQTPGNRPQLK